ncbi:unnamed protein product [Leptidea sinapis]|uniref:C2H2-type domain-containing protein n=1 Tax=Leptidea sinapis TaxID=189913 RepID=A0A5E4QM05_9NEOP|nr:unnamed protein product [Leptidea sinapis]
MSLQLIKHHVKSHLTKKRKKDSNEDGGTSKNSRARKNHVARFHREGLQCDHCKKRFVNRTTLATHLKLHEGPPPRKECPICGKMVRVIQLKYHIQRHQTSTKYECEDCSKVFSHLATYQAHLNFVSFRIPDFLAQCATRGIRQKKRCKTISIINTWERQLTNVRYPIASKANIEKHIMRVHKEKKEKPKNHVCRL